MFMLPIHSFVRAMISSTRLRTIRLLSIPCIVALSALITREALGWGFWAHRQINRQAVQLLPAEMQGFFLTHVEYLSAHSVDPDVRRETDSLEQFYHYLDIDYYGVFPFEELPRDFRAAVAKYGIDTVRKQGLLPWRIAAYTDSLSDAMRRKDEGGILHFAAELGHYIGDAHVPLHTVVDYDGVRRGQRGVHKRWESDLTERFGTAFAYPSSGAFFVEDPLKQAFDIILESFTLAESVFVADAEAVQKTPNARSVRNVRRNGDTVYVYSDAYYRAFKTHDRGLVERRMQKAIIRLASYWFTAWANAGKPDLPMPAKM